MGHSCDIFLVSFPVRNQFINFYTTVKIELKGDFIRSSKMNYDDLLRNYQSGAEDVNHLDVNGSTLLMWMSHQGNTDIVRGLLERGADTNKTGFDEYYSGCSALDAACSRGHIEIVKLLLDHGANIARVNPVSGWTPLIYAAYYNHIEVVKYLLNFMTDEQIRHAGLHRRNFYGKPFTALNIAIRKKHGEIVTLIRGALALSRLERLRCIKRVVFKVFDAMDKHEVMEPTLGPSLTIAEFCGVPQGLCHSPSSCRNDCRHFCECPTCGYTTKYRATMTVHQRTHL